MALKFVLVEIVLVETVLVGDPLTKGLKLFLKLHILTLYKGVPAKKKSIIISRDIFMIFLTLKLKVFISHVVNG